MRSRSPCTLRCARILIAEPEREELFNTSGQGILPAELMLMACLTPVVPELRVNPPRSSPASAECVNHVTARRRQSPFLV